MLAIEKYFESFKKQDTQAMASAYSGDIVFFDPLADLLKESEVEVRWHLFFEDAMDCSITHQAIIDLGDDYYTCKWQAIFIHSQTKRPVTLNAKANIKLQENKIAEYSDAFSLHQYCTQAFGGVAYLLGWNSIYQKRKKNDFRRRILQHL